MTYPPQGQYPQQPQQGYPPQGPPPGYGAPQGGYPNQAYPQQGPPQGPPQGYAQPPAAGYQQAPVQQSFSFADVYNTAEASGGMIPEDWYPELCEKSEFGRTKAGDKWAWTIVFRISSGQHLGRQLTMTLSLSPTKSDGSPNNVGMGIAFRHLSALGVPVGEKFSGNPGEQPWFAQFPVPQGAPPEVQNAAIKAAGDYAAQLMVGRPGRIKVIQDHEWNNNKVRDIAPARPGDPTVMPQQAQGQGPPQQAYPQPQQAYPQPGPQPVGPGGQPPWQGQPQQAPSPQGYPQGGPQAPPPYGQAGPSPQQYPPQGAPDPAGQPGMAQFTPQGQAPQGQQMPQQPPWQGQPNGAPPQQQAPQGQQGAPPPPPWAQQ